MSENNNRLAFELSEYWHFTFIVINGTRVYNLVRKREQPLSFGGAKETGQQVEKVHEAAQRK